MSAQDYAVTFPYGATSAPYSPSHPHRGNDRPCPTGTPVVIGDQTLGLTGNTGQYNGQGYAPHLHIQEWNGNKATTRKPQNEFKGGVVTEVDRSGTGGDGSLGKWFTIRTPDGWSDSYCHLSRIDVKIGDIIGGDMEPKWNEGDAVNFNVWHYGKDLGRFREYIGKGYKDAIGQICTTNPYYLVDALINDGDIVNIKAVYPTLPGVDGYVGKTWKDFYYGCMALNAQPAQFVEYQQPKLFVKKEG